MYVVLGNNDGIAFFTQFEYLLVRVDVLTLLKTNSSFLFFRQIQVRTSHQAVNEAIKHIPK